MVPSLRRSPRDKVYELLSYEIFFIHSTFDLRWRVGETSPSAREDVSQGSCSTGRTTLQSSIVFVPTPPLGSVDSSARRCSFPSLGPDGERKKNDINYFFMQVYFCVFLFLNIFYFKLNIVSVQLRCLYVCVHAWKRLIAG